MNNISDNKYYKGSNDASLKGMASGFGYGFGATSSAFSWAGAVAPIFGIIGGSIGMLVGGITANEDYIDDVINTRDLYVNDMKKATKSRNQLIMKAQNQVTLTKNSIDSKYGKGMFDMYDDLFQQTFKIEAGKTLSDFFEKMEFDNVAGEITSKSMTGDELKKASNVLSLSDLNEKYYEYFTNQIKSANTAYGMEARYNASLLKNTITNYYQDYDMLTAQAANQFQQTFLNYVTENAQGEIALGSASAKEGASGLKQKGKLTNLQEFQNDIAQVAYASNLNYLITQFTSSMTKLQTSMVDQVDSIRTKQQISDRQVIESTLDAYNQHNANLSDAMLESKDTEGAITEMNKEIGEIDEFLEHDSIDRPISAEEKKKKVTMEDLF